MSPMRRLLQTFLYKCWLSDQSAMIKFLSVTYTVRPLNEHIVIFQYAG